MTNFKDSAFAKVTTGVVAFSAGLFMLGFASVVAAPNTADAQSNEELQAQIESLLNTIASLQSQVDGETSAGVSGECPASIYSSSLGEGDEGQSVRDLQVFLNMDADTQIASSGPGSPGNETNYYGSLTANAVSDFQAKYSADVLAPLGLSAPTGYWGNSSQSKAQSLCASMADDSDDSDDDADDSDDDSSDDSDDDSDDSDDSDLEGGEASLESFDLDDVDDVQEGDSAEVAEFEFDVEDGDVNVSRADVTFTRTGGDGDDEPWDVFEEVMLMADGDEIASVDVSDEDDWLDDDGETLDGDNSPNTGDYTDDEGYTVRFNDLDTVVRDGDTAEFTLAVEAQDNIDGVNDEDVEWATWIQDEGIRAVDSEDIQSYTGDHSESAEFDVEAEGQGEELNINSSSDDPDESIIEVEDDDQSDEYGVFAFDMEAEENDIELDKANVEVDLGNMSYLSTDHSGNNSYEGWYDDIVSDAYLEIDGEQFDVDSEDVTSLDANSDTSGTTSLSFDIDGDYTIDADDEATAMLFLEFNGTDDYNQDVTVQASIANDGDIEGEGADDVDSDGTVTGDEHTLLSSGLYSDSAADINTSSTEDNIQYEFDVDLTAFEDNAYLSATSSVSGGSLDADNPFGFTISSDNGTTTTYDVVSTADTNNSNNFVINEGDTETFTITVFYNADDKSGHRMTLDTVDFNTDNSTTYGSTYNFTPESDYRSGLVSEESNSN